MIVHRGAKNMLTRLIVANVGIKRSRCLSHPSLSSIFPANCRAAALAPARSFASKTSDEKGTPLRRARKELNATSKTTAAAPTDEKISVEISSAYVHPLSQVVLRHFQTSCHEWICAQHLDQNLVLHRDGTFMLERPAEHGGEHSSSLRIWTYYDKEDRKHWLSVSLSQARFQFLLQDNLLTAWQGHKRRSLTERIEESVQDLMDSVDGLKNNK